MRSRSIRQIRHDLIPADIWFADRIPAWRQQYLVTYESLPIAQAQFERLDKRRQNHRFD